MVCCVLHSIVLSVQNHSVSHEIWKEFAKDLLMCRAVLHKGTEYFEVQMSTRLEIMRCNCKETEPCNTNIACYCDQLSKSNTVQQVPCLANNLQQLIFAYFKAVSLDKRSQRILCFIVTCSSLVNGVFCF